MDKSVQVCISCNTSLAIGLKLHFCPYCGTAQLEKKLLEQKTTQHFDPDNPSHKPWREKPRLPKRNYKNVPTKKPQPWCPPMRQLRVRPAKAKPTRQGIEESINTAAEHPTDVTNAAGDLATNNIDIGTVDAETDPNAETTEPEAPPEPYLGFYTESTCPIAVYDAEHWLAIGGMAVNISLVQQTLGLVNHGYWLRVGVMFDDDMPAQGAGSGVPPNTVEAVNEDLRAAVKTEGFGDPVVPNAESFCLEDIITADEDEALPEEEEGLLYTIAVLSSDAAKLMVPHVDDWVDLCAIDPTEYYMARHMEKVLQSLAHRVVTTNLNELACRQEYSVEMRRRTKQSKLSSTLAAVNGLISAAVLERMTVHTSSAAWNYNANQVVCTELNETTTASGSPNRGGMMTRTRTSISVSFLDWVVQLSHKLVLTRGISVRYIPAVVRLSVRYDNRLSDPHEFQSSFQQSSAASSPQYFSSRPMSPERSGKTSHSFSDAGSGLGDPEEPYSSESAAAVETEVNTGKYVDPRMVEKNRKLRRFAESQKVTHVVLSITPVAVSTDEVMPPAVLSFDLASINALLKSNAPFSIDELLADAKRGKLILLAKRLASLLRLEYTGSGIKYAVVGVFSEPTHISCGWPVDQVNLDDDSDVDLSELVPPVDDEPEAAVVPEPEEEQGIELDEAPLDAYSPSPSPEKVEEPVPAEEVVAIPPPQPTPRRPDPPVLCGYCTCPLHPTLPASAPCSCLRREVSIKGSSLWVYGDFSRTGNDSLAEGAEELSCLSDLRALIDRGITVQCANSLTLLAVDQVDESLSCTITVSASQVTSLLLRMTSGAPTGPGQTGAAAAVVVDVTKHPALLDELFTGICSETHMDLFLSRKSRLMKVSVK